MKTIFDILTNLIKTSGIAVAPKKEQIIWQSGHKSVSLLRRSDDKLILVSRNSQVTTSRPVAYLGRDLNNISGPKAIWKLTFDAKQNYDIWAGAAQGQRTYKYAPGDGGISDQDLDASLPAEYQRMLRQEMARREQVRRCNDE